MADIRRKTFQDMGANLVRPSVSKHVFGVGESVAATVRSGVLHDQTWTLNVRQACSGQLVRTLKGNATPSDPIQTVWNGRDANGKSVPPGRYRLTLTSSAGNSQSWPWSTVVS